jgi:hypothetical protein
LVDKPGGLVGLPDVPEKIGIVELRPGDPVRGL